jgi:outer membrane protein TolC
MDHTIKCIWLTVIIASIIGIAGCRTPEQYREQADQVAYDIIGSTRAREIDNPEPFSIETPEVTLRRRLIAMQDLPAYSRATLSARELEPPPHWPQNALPPTLSETNQIPVRWAHDGTVSLSLLDTLQIAARNNRGYQSSKEKVFRSALQLDLERNRFRSTFGGALDSTLSNDNSGSERVSGSQTSSSISATKTLKTGAALSGALAVDLAKLLTGDRSSAWGISADATISIPLLRGAGKHIARESLTQAERNVVYAIHAFEEFKRGLSVSVATEFFNVMQATDQTYNAQRNYETLEASVDRARAMAKAGRLPEIQVDQTHQNKLRAYDRLISSRQNATQTLDGFKVSLGLPPDAAVELIRDAFTELIQDAKQKSEENAPIPDVQNTIIAALENRLDMRNAAGQVQDAQRAVVIAADALRAEISLLGSAAAGSGRSLSSASEKDAQLDLSKGILSGLLTIDLPIERTAERNAFRNAITDLEAAVRASQEMEDQIKLQIRGDLRDLSESRESIVTQLEAVRLAERRQNSTGLFLKAGRAEMRDIIEAEESLLSVRNALTSAIINYRIAELRLQRDVGILSVTDDGFTQEHTLTASITAAPSIKNSGDQNHE